jgi:hypothetical protein
MATIRVKINGLERHGRDCVDPTVFSLLEVQVLVHGTRISPFHLLLYKHHYLVLPVVPDTPGSTQILHISGVPGTWYQVQAQWSCMSQYPIGGKVHFILLCNLYIPILY